MKKKHGLLGTPVWLLVFGFIAGGCVSTGKTYVYDKKAPEENLSQLFVSEGLSFGRFDGKRVKWEERDTIKIPAGEHTLSFKYRHVSYEFLGGHTVTTANLERTHDFQPGWRYTLMATTTTDDKTGKLVGVAFIVPYGYMRGFTPPSDRTKTKFEGKWKGLGGDNDYFVFTGNEFESAGLAKGFFEFTDTELRLGRKWERTDINAEWTEPQEIMKIGGRIPLPVNSAPTVSYQFDVDGNLVVNLQTYRKVTE
jgi:hypothetical protein